MAIATFQKDPSAKLDYEIDWSDWLNGDTLASSSWTGPAGITHVTDSNTAILATIRLSGGTHGVDYEWLNHVITSSGQEDERSIIVQVRQVEAGATSDATDRANAIQLLSEWVQIDVVPTLLQNEIETILDRHKVASTWTASTPYAFGEKILPPIRNGWWYSVTQPGVSGGVTRDYFQWPASLGVRIVDGDSVPALILEASGPDSIFRALPSNPPSVNVYDVRAAARECWDLKLSRVSQFIDVSDLKFSQVHDHCAEKVKQFRPIRWPVELIRC